MSNFLTIGEASKQTGVPSKTIRYYEESGLLPSAERAENGYRIYSERAIHLLRFVKRARDLGFSVQDVSSLLALWADDTRASSEVKKLAIRHLDDIEAKISGLKELRNTMRDLIDCCHGDDRPDCPILENIAMPKKEKTNDTL